MRRGRRSNILLLELLLVVFFFMVGVTLLARVFIKAGTLRRQARIQEQALIDCQSLDDRLYRAGDREALLAAEGFAAVEGEEADRVLSLEEPRTERTAGQEKTADAEKEPENEDSPQASEHSVWKKEQEGYAVYVSLGEASGKDGGSAGGSAEDVSYWMIRAAYENEETADRGAGEGSGGEEEVFLILPGARAAEIYETEAGEGAV